MMNDERRRNCRMKKPAFLLLSLFAVTMPAVAGEPALPRLEDVDTPFSGGGQPRPEHPFPQMMRAEWLNLNGTWEFAETDNTKDQSFLTAAAYPDKIVVPFCRESKLSGLGRTGFVKNVWYRRTFRKPAGWKSPRVRLHVGACDWQARVWVNGQLVGGHTGGSAPLAFDVTERLKPGDNTVIIHAFDDTRSGLQATGKQAHSLKSEGCVYTRTTGIWQTVWLEGVGSAFIRDVRIEPDIKGSRVLIQAEVEGDAAGLTLRAVASSGKQVVGAAEAPADWRDNRLVLNLSQKRLWSPEDPFLYGLRLTLAKRGQNSFSGRENSSDPFFVDQVDSYFGLREVTIRGAAILINGKAVFQRTVLDQGFYPDGIWTAPSDAALRRDIELAKAVGFNGARLHQKVFEPRFLYWADKLGYLVWGEFPNWGLNYRNPAVNLPVINEWVEIVRRDRNHPAVIGWCPFNETPPEAGPLQAAVVNVTRAIDPTRPIIESSGYFHGIPNPDALDAHDYNQNPASFRQRWGGKGVRTIFSGPPGDGSLAEPRKNSSDPFSLPERYRIGHARRMLPFFVSEYGGIGWDVSGGWGYGNAPKSLEAFYARYQGLTDALLDNRYLFGYCYTQLTDVEQEHNGMYYYDRRPKFDVARIRKIQSRQAAYEKDPPLEIAKSQDNWRVLVGAVPDGALARPWRYTLEAPPHDWTAPGFDDGQWKLGRAGFGQKGDWERYIKTPWRTKDIWLRQEFACDRTAFGRAMLVTHYDNGTEVYLNGKLVWKGEGWNDQYDGFDVTAALKAALKEGKNTVAIHCHQDEGGQFIDVALLAE
jgi:hypothetical protein